MSLTGLLWICLFVGLSIASLKRPVFAAIGHLMVFYASPVFWWFGGGLLTSLTMRWSLVAVFVLAIANLLSFKNRPRRDIPGRIFMQLLLLMSLNAFFVHHLFADYPPESEKVFDILWKGCLATALFYISVRSLKDLELVMLAMVVGCGFVGFQIVLSGQGFSDGGRLEGIRFAGAQGSNGTAAVLSVGLVVAAYFVLTMKNKWFGLVSFASAPLVLESILRCNSRGCYLGLITSAIAIVVFARGPARKRAIGLCVLGVVAILLMAGDASIWNRFESIFVSADERDNSASERLDYWQAAIKMIADFPLGSGGEAAFTSPRGVRYIAHFRDEFRSVHNGPLDVAAGWGVQGLFLMTLVLCTACLSAWRTLRQCMRDQNVNDGLIGTVLISAIIGQLVCSLFTSILDGEWFLWLAACCFAYTRLMRSSEELETDDSEFDDEPADDLGEDLDESGLSEFDLDGSGFVH
ncbi:O-antigen ligase family protein [Rubripirellula reticaptiva]|uniref:O-Antigen ligase n=1 Tax=Rubripirellula reticaptiva TaxID=2528013 RepID=A0A5C6F6H9_9BACT|nr:O-antigen ligase family protein [Rubripirellula reticaptiva]TWU55686.1 O-Antigen ligase [Rubripirellula reticaptiva]